MTNIIDEVKITRIINNTLQPNPIRDLVAIETPIEIVINNGDIFTLLCSPTKIKELVCGFLYTHDLINSRDNIQDIYVNDNKAKVKISLLNKNKCTRENSTEQNILKTDTRKVFSIMKKLIESQENFTITGCTHAAAIFNSNGEIIVFNEDVARHNAFDKSVGECLLKEINLTDKGVVLSSRVSYDMMKKAVAANIQMVIAVSAPSSLAIRTAQQNNITLCGFVRNNNANIYTHPFRIHKENFKH